MGEPGDAGPAMVELVTAAGRLVAVEDGWRELCRRSTATPI